MITLEIRGFDLVARKISRMSPIVVQVSEGHVKATIQRITARAKGMAPRDTGTLARSITYVIWPGRTKASVGIRAGSPAEVYWFFVEYGTRYVRARPYFRPAADGEMGRFGSGMNALLRRLIEGV